MLFGIFRGSGTAVFRQDYFSDLKKQHRARLVDNTGFNLLPREFLRTWVCIGETAYFREEHCQSNGQIKDISDRQILLHRLPKGLLYMLAKGHSEYAKIDAEVVIATVSPNAYYNIRKLG